jgi:hypothetical protein
MTGIFTSGDLYALNTPVTDVGVFLQDYVVARPVSYVIRFKTGHALSGRIDTITIEFPEEISISSDITRENVGVNNYTSGGIDYTDGILRVLVPEQINILAGEVVEVTVASGVINNPREAGAYRLTAYTSQDSYKVESEKFQITDYEYSNGVSKPSVRVGVLSSDSAPEYSISFKTSANGRLEPGDYIYLTFPTGTVMPTSIERSTIKINDTILNYRPDIDGRKISLVVPSLTIPAKGEVEIIVSSDADIIKPTATGYHTIKVSTSVETREITSFAWEVKSGGTETTEIKKGLTVTPLPNGQGQAAAYTITINPGLLRALSNSINNLVLMFPPGTVLPDSISADKVSVNGQTVAGCLVNEHTNELIIVFPDTYSSDAQIVVHIDKSAGIVNGNTAQHKLEISTSQSSSTVMSDWYTIYEQATNANTSNNTTTVNTTTPTSSSNTTGCKIELRIDSNLAYIDGVLQILDAAPTIIDNVTMVPLRFVADYLGATTAYDSSTASVIVKLDAKEITLWVNSGMAKVDGVFVSMNAEAVNINNRLMIPVRFVTENLGAKVSWNGTTRVITITKGNVAETTTTVQKAYPINSKVYVKSEHSHVNLRSGPGTSYELAGRMNQGEVATIIMLEGSWYKVQLSSGLEAWVADWVVDIR